MDYAVPRAFDLPFYATDLSEVPSTTHPLGIRPHRTAGRTPARDGLSRMIRRAK
jgi:carbon-monoxide dehydrogenase large subunit